MRALLLHNDPASAAGTVGERLAERGYELVEHTVDQRPASQPRTPIPAVTDFDAVVVFGGPCSLVGEVADSTWVAEETAALRTAHDHEIPVLGVCLGGQLVALAHGGGVERAAEPQFGWFAPADSAQPVLAGEWFQWHHDSWTPPPGSQQQAGSERNPQAFTLGRTLALQFHPEITATALELTLAADGEDELHGIGLDPAALLRETREHDDDNQRRAHRLVDAWLDDLPFWSTTPAAADAVR